VEVTSIFVYPFGFRWDEPAYRSFELSQRLVQAGIKEAGDVFSFYGPGEFKVLRAEDNGAWVATTALQLMISSGARPEQGLMIRPWAERRMASASHETEDAKGRGAGRSDSEETVYVGHIEVVHPSTHSVLMEAETMLKVDPFAATPDAEFDPAPALTAMMEKLMTQAVSKATKWSSSRKLSELPKLQFSYTPQHALEWADEMREAATVEFAKMDIVDQEMFLAARARYLNPTLKHDEAMKLSHLGAGLRVTQGGKNLVPGDLIVALGPVPAAPQVWQRLRFSGPFIAKVKKENGNLIEMLLP
jgi:hypothetical protein